MAIYPGAVQQLIPKWNKVKIKRHRRMNLHVAVSNAQTIRSMFARSNSACSHFYVAFDGTVYQYIDTKYRSASDLNGNDSTISVETAGGVTDPDGQPWTPEQFAALVDLWAWARDTHGIKNQVAKNTQTNDNSAGLSWHRLGVVGNFSDRPGILSTSYQKGGILYSKARGKICPGDAKILQIPEIWAAANRDGGTVKPAGKPAAKPKPKPKPKAQPTDYANLAVDGKFGPTTVAALQIVMRAIKTYSRAVDGKFGKHSVIALQQFLADRGHLDRSKWLIDGKFGPATVRALQSYLNTQN